jgi:hypothetical protein
VERSDRNNDKKGRGRFSSSLPGLAFFNNAINVGQ